MVILLRLYTIRHLFAVNGAALCWPLQWNNEGSRHFHIGFNSQTQMVCLLFIYWQFSVILYIRYCGTGQPNSFNGNQDCGEFVQEKGGGEWNDDGCSGELLICEK